MKFKELIGIDVSKLVLDAHLHLKAASAQFDNDPDGIAKLLDWCEQQGGCKTEDLFFVFEHTGLYSHQLAVELSRLKLSYSIEPGLAVRRSLGITRGKNDKIDARELALYGYRRRDELSPYQLPDKELQQLKVILKLRDRMVKQRSGYKASLKEQKRVLEQDQYQLVLKAQNKMIQQLSAHIKELEAKIKSIIKANQELKTQYQLITSVKGVGPQTAWHFIVATHGCKRFKTWREFAAYCGTAPFPYQSGSSIRGRTKVSHLANKNIKKLINMCAMSAIQHDPQLKAYYKEKTAQGKNKISVINAVRNKILARVFAVLKRGTPYVNTHKFAA